MSNLTSLFSTFLIGISFFFGTVYADWAYMFVVNDGNIYVISQEQVDPSQIGSSKIGEVTKYSDIEGTYSGNFSNRYPKGTEYYEINGVEIKEAIAVQEGSELFIKANYNGEYAGSKYSWQGFLLYFIGLILLLGVVYLIKKRSNR